MRKGIIALTLLVLALAACGGGGNKPGDTRVQPNDVNFNQATASLDNTAIQGVLSNNMSATLQANGSTTLLSPKSLAVKSGKSDESLVRVAKLIEKAFQNPLLKDRRIQQGVLPLLSMASGVSIKAQTGKNGILYKLTSDDYFAEACTSGSMELSGLPASVENAIKTGDESQVNATEIANAIKNGIDLKLSFNKCDNGEGTVTNGSFSLTFKVTATETSLTSNFKFNCDGFSSTSSALTYTCGGGIELDQTASVANNTDLTYDLKFAANNFEATSKTSGGDTTVNKVDGALSAQLTGTVEAAGTTAISTCETRLGSGYASYCSYIPMILGSYIPKTTATWTLIVVADLRYTLDNESNTVLEAVKLTYVPASESYNVVFAVWVNSNDLSQGYYLVTVKNKGGATTCSYEVTFTDKDGNTKTVNTKSCEVGKYGSDTLLWEDL